MNVIEVVHALVSMAPMEREMVLDIVNKASRKASPEAQHARAINKTKDTKARYDVYQRRHIDKVFRAVVDSDASDADLHKIISETAKDVHRSFGAIERKWREFAANKVEHKTWDQWVKGSK